MMMMMMMMRRRRKLIMMVMMMMMFMMMMLMLMTIRTTMGIHTVMIMRENDDADVEGDDKDDVDGKI